jgi:ADP-ribose pyrophosphatase
VTGSKTTDVGDWPELERQSLFDCRIFSVECSRVKSPQDGHVHDFYRILSVDWVQIVPVTVKREIVMVRQYRHGSGEVTLEIPGGLVDSGEDARTAAVRECLEETGYRASEVHSLGSVNPNPALFANRLYSFVAESAEPVAPIRNEGAEQTALELVPEDQLPELLLSGRIDHALVATTLWRYVYQYLPTAVPEGAGRR